MHYSVKTNVHSHLHAGGVNLTITQSDSFAMPHQTILLELVRTFLPSLLNEAKWAEVRNHLMTKALLVCLDKEWICVLEIIHL